MRKILTSSFGSVDAARNAVDELINAGFPREQVMREEHGSTVKVMTPAASEDEVREILERHDPTLIEDRPA